MNKKIICTTIFVLLLSAAMLLCGCDKSSSAAGACDPTEAGAETVEKLSDEQALSAIMNYCYAVNPDLEDIVTAGEYPVYWIISSSDESEAVVLFRSYTGAQNRYYIDRITGNTHVTEFVPGITADEQPTGESFNARDYLSGD